MYFILLVLLQQDPLANGEVKPDVSPAKEVAVDGHIKSD